MNLVHVTDAWPPQDKGVVRTLQETIRNLERAGHHIDVISPQGFRSIPCPTYPEIPLVLFPGREVARRLGSASADAVHIVTEGPGCRAPLCLREGIPFTTAYHTALPLAAADRVPGTAKSPLPTIICAGFTARRAR